MTETTSDYGSVLVVDDNEQNRRLLARLLSLEGYVVHTAADGESALAAARERAPDIVLLDVQMPGLDGFEVCRQIKQDPAMHLTPVIMVTALRAREHRIKGINAGADDFISKPFDAEELRARVRSLVRLKRHTDELESAEDVIASLALTVEARDAYTDGHCQRLSSYAVVLGEALGLPASDLDALHRGGYLHDVGKVGVPDAVLLKPGALNPEEFEVMKRHTIIGEGLCGNLRTLAAVRPIIRHHHECLDGSGYPDGLRGSAVPLLAQIVSIVDAYDAITTTRPYRAARPASQAHDELRGDAERGERDRELVATFIAVDKAGRLAERSSAEVRHRRLSRESAPPAS